MRLSGRLLYLSCFLALAVVAALCLARVGRPSIAPLLVWAALTAGLAGAPGLIDRRAWPAALVLLPAGAYLVLRFQTPLPAHLHGLVAQYDFYLAQVRTGAHAYIARTFPFHLADTGQLKLLLALIAYIATGLASLAALSLRRPLPAVVIFLVLLGFSLTVDGTGSVILLPLAFLFLAGCLLALSRSLQRGRGAPSGVAAGAGVAALAALLALVLLAATPVAAGKPWRDWSTWGLLGQSPSHVEFDWMLNFPSLLDPRTNATVLTVESPLASYWRANALETFDGEAWLSSPSTAQLAVASPTTPETYFIAAAGRTPRGPTIREAFKLQSLSTSFLFAGGAPREIALGGHDPLTADSAQALRLQRPVGSRFTYVVAGVIPRLKPADLVARGRRYPADVLPDTALPFAGTAADFTSQTQWRAAMDDSPADREWLGLYQLDRKIVGRATDPYQITLRIEQYLRGHYSYSLTPPPTRYASPYAAFLFDTMVGYCQHFAGAMAVLERFNGIPARVAVGFTTGVCSPAKSRSSSAATTPTPGSRSTSPAWAGCPSSPRPATASPAPARRRPTPASSIPSPATPAPAARRRRVPRRPSCGNSSTQGPQGSARQHGARARLPVCRAGCPGLSGSSPSSPPTRSAGPPHGTGTCAGGASSTACGPRSR